MSAWPFDVTFLRDEKVRSIVEDYHAHAVKAYDAGSYLGALVACGAVLEGILTWALLQRKEAAIKAPGAQKNDKGQVLPLERWNLTSLIDVAFTIGVLGKTARDASWAVKEFRNFIHPYKILGKSARADQSLATSALAAVHEIVRSLRGRIAP